MALSVKLKLSMTTLIPLSCALFFSISTLLDLKEKSASISYVTVLVQLTEKNSALVHELQKERGATAGFLSSKGKSFGEILRNQRASTDKKLSALNHYLEENKGQVTSSEVLALISESQLLIQQISNTRLKVDQQNIEVKGAISFYTNLNKLLLSTAAVISEYSPNSAMTQKLMAYYSFLQGKERAGIERAVLSNAFSKGELSKSGFEKLITLITQQNTYFSSFSEFTTRDQNVAFTAMMNESAIKKVNEYRDYARAGEMMQSSEDWFSQATKRINLLKGTEDSLAEVLLNYSSEIKRISNTTFLLWLIVSVIMTAVTIGLSFLILRGIQRQVATLRQTLDDAAVKRNLKARSDVLSQDELGSIAVNLNSMLDVFAQSIDTITDASHQLSAASEESSAMVASNSQDLMSQQEETLQVAAAIEEMTSTAKDVAQNTTTAADASQDAEAIIETGGDAVRRAVDAINGVSSQVQVAGESINRLHESSNNISTVINVIKGIAEQTNLLALNAAIEAARAGEQGRGFAVVADEVRTLAQRTQESTAEIESMIKQFQSDSSKAYEQMNDGRESVETSVMLVNEVSEQLQNITSANMKISDMTVQIAAATEEQVAVSEDVAQKMQLIGDKSQSAATGGEQIAGAAHEQAMLASTLEKMASEFKT